MCRISSLFILLMLGLDSFAQTPAAFRGLNGDGVFSETGLMKSWPEAGPQCILTVEGIGKGFSSAVESEGHVYITGMKEGKDWLTAIGPDGKISWQVPFGTSWTKSFPDTRTTPSVEKNRVYVISGTGRLVCIEASDGSEIWSQPVDSVYESRWHDWGVAESPFILDNLVICTPAGNKASVVAYDKLTGKPVWQAAPTEGQRSYASPVLATFYGKRFILASTTTELISVEPETGKTAWIFKHWQADRDAMDDAGQIYCNNPTVLGNDIFLTRGYDYPCMMITVNPDTKTVTEKWMNTTLDNHHHGVILSEGCLFGSNWINNGNGNWFCLDWATGAVKWEEKWFNKGPVVFADGLLYNMDEKYGNVGLIRPNPSKFDLVSTFKIDKGTGPFWAHPSIYHGRLYLRHGDVLLGYDIKGGT